MSLIINLIMGERIIFWASGKGTHTSFEYAGGLSELKINYTDAKVKQSDLLLRTSHIMIVPFIRHQLHDVLDAVGNLLFLRFSAFQATVDGYPPCFALSVDVLIHLAKEVT
jgi:hypothetical protein